MRSHYLSEAETAYARTVLLAVELVDVVTLQIVSRQVQVTATGLARPPLVSASGRFVWVADGARRPARVQVDPGGLPYDAEDVAAPSLPPDLDQVPAAGRLLRVWLRPRRGYAFPDGVTVVRGRLAESALGAAMIDAEVWIEWLDEATQQWHDERTRGFARTRLDGEFVAFLRLAPSAQAAVDGAGLLALRLGVKRGGAVRHTVRFSLREGGTLGRFMRVAWSELH
jgi:hypothetical protein